MLPFSLIPWGSREQIWKELTNYKKLGHPVTCASQIHPASENRDSNCSNPERKIKAEAEFLMTAIMTSPVGRDGGWWLQPPAVSSRVSMEGTRRQAFSLYSEGVRMLSILFCPLQLHLEDKEPTRGLTQETRSCFGQRQSGNWGIWAGLGCHWGRTAVC